MVVQLRHNVSEIVEDQAKLEYSDSEEEEEEA